MSQQALIMGFSVTFAVIGFVFVANPFTRKVQAGGAAAVHFCRPFCNSLCVREIDVDQGYRVETPLCVVSRIRALP